MKKKKRIFLLTGLLLGLNIQIYAQCNADFRVSQSYTCVNSPIYFLNTSDFASGTTFQWNFGPGASPATSTLQNPPPVTYTTPGQKDVELIISRSGCWDNRTRQIDVASDPVVSFASSAPECTGVGVDFQYTGDLVLEYLWTFGEGAVPTSSVLKDPTGIIYDTPGTKVVTLTVTYGFCSKTITQNVIINGTPETGFTSTAPQCTGLTVDFTNTGTTGLSYSWDFGTGATPSTSTDENPTGIIYSSSGSKIISLTTTNTGSGCSATTNQSININQTPSTGFTSTAPVCVEEGVDFSNTGTSGNEWIYNWDFGEDANPSTSTSENPVNIMYSTGGSKAVSLTIFNSFCSNTSTDIIDINSLPIAFAGIDTTICANRSIQLGTDPTADYQYSWFPPDIFDFPESSNPIASPIASFTNIILTVTNTVTGCQAVDSVSLTMLNPMIANAGNDVEICFGDVIQIGASLIEGQYYTWSPASGLDDAFLPNPLSSPDTTTLYTLTVNANGCDPVFDEVLVQVHPLPDANAGLNDTITTGSEIRLIATGGIQYIWSPPYALSNTAVFNPIANPTETTIYTVSVTDVYGCVNSDDVEITVIDPSYWVPNAFTPDGNGTNDVFYVRGEGISNFELYIFDRSGHLVYYSQDFYEGWTGKMQGSNKELPEGAYLFKIKGTDSTGSPIEDSGMINLIR